jgi:DNA polymerase III delta prime subunit
MIYHAVLLLTQKKEQMNLWTETYRPKSVADYVFRDDQQKQQVLSWVKDGIFPHLVFSGSPGTGKCLVGSEMVDVEIDVAHMSAEQLKQLDAYYVSANTYCLPIQHLFVVLGLDNIMYDTPTIAEFSVNIKSPRGFVRVNAFVKKHHATATYELANGQRVSCSVDHLVFEHGVAKKIKECESVDTTTGTHAVVNKTPLGTQEVYDVALGFPHQYVTPNGIIHHNTTLAKLLIAETNVDSYDILEINASRENSADTIRDKIVNFVSTIPFGRFKVVLLDEADFLSLSAQSILRGVMETYASTARFILTANFPNKIMPAIHSRTQGFHIEKLDITEFTARLATILVTENIEFSLDTLDTYVKATYPDLRKCINACQMNSTSGELIASGESTNSGNTSDYLVRAVDLIKRQKIRDAREVICSNARPEEIDQIYRWMYDHLELWGSTPETQDRAILIIRQGLVNHSLVSDPEINLSACLVELANIGE